LPKTSIRTVWLFHVQVDFLEVDHFSSIQQQMAFHLVAKVAFEAFGADHHVGFDFVAF
jgi:hypothetical protein